VAENLSLIAVCDHLALLFRGKLEHEIGWKTAEVAADLLIQAGRGHAVDLRQVRVAHGPQPAQKQNASVEATPADKCNAVAHAPAFRPEVIAICDHL